MLSVHVSCDTTSEPISSRNEHESEKRYRLGRAVRTNRRDFATIRFATTSMLDCTGPGGHKIVFSEVHHSDMAVVLNGLTREQRVMMQAN